MELWIWASRSRLVSPNSSRLTFAATERKGKRGDRGQCVQCSLTNTQLLLPLVVSGRLCVQSFFSRNGRPSHCRWAQKSQGPHSSDGAARHSSGSTRDRSPPMSQEKCSGSDDDERRCSHRWWGPSSQALVMERDCCHCVMLLLLLLARGAAHVGQLFVPAASSDYPGGRYLPCLFFLGWHRVGWSSIHVQACTAHRIYIALNSFLSFSPFINAEREDKVVTSSSLA